MSLQPCSPGQLEKLRPYLNEWVGRMEEPSYIKDDPVSFMHAFESKEDQALAGFFAAIMAWGRRDIVLAKVENLLGRMDHQPEAFIRNFSDGDAAVFEGFKHRTFKPVDMYGLTIGLQAILLEHGSFEAFWRWCYAKSQNSGRELMTVFHHAFFDAHEAIESRTRKHISNPEKGSACKRLYLYLRWVIRNDSPVDPGIMDFMKPSGLRIPLDVHSARQARALGLLTRTYNDWKATRELTDTLRRLDPDDPAKYDYALFGIGVNQHIIPNEFILNPQLLT